MTKTSWLIYFQFNSDVIDSVKNVHCSETVFIACRLLCIAECRVYKPNIMCYILKVI